MPLDIPFISQTELKNERMSLRRSESAKDNERSENTTRISIYDKLDILVDVAHQLDIPSRRSFPGSFTQVQHF